MGDVGSAYAGVRERITALVRSADPDLIVPSCPAWSVKDVVAHVTGVVDDVLAGRLDGVATDAWTEAQVVARRDRPLDDILREWAEKAPAFEGMLDDIGLPGQQAVFDVTTHEHDLRGALRQGGAHDSDGVRIGLGWVAPQFVAGMPAAGLPSLCLRTEDGDEWMTDGSPIAIVTASAFEFLRCLSGRRSRAQLQALNWTGDAEPYLPAFEFGPFRTPENDVLD